MEVMERRRGGDNFDSEYSGREVRLYLYGGAKLTGRVEASRYWLKVTSNGKTIYVNKAYVMMVEPLE
ncbi:MAG: hypothetical protein QXU64_02120 [Thermofilaceae archaeon]